MGVRLSAADFIPFTKGPGDIGEPVSYDQPYQEAFGGDGTGTGIDLTEVYKVLAHFGELGIELVCITAGSPYYTPHLLRPALFPPSDGYLPPEDPLVGVARQIEITKAIKKRFPDLVIVGSAYSYLQEWLPHVAEAVMDGGLADFVGLGRMVLSYPEMANDILKGNALTRGKICRTFSDCTTGPRIGMLSGCFPLDPYYKEMQEAITLKEFKKNTDL